MLSTRTGYSLLYCCYAYPVCQCGGTRLWYQCGGCLLLLYFAFCSQQQQSSSTTSSSSSAQNTSSQTSPSTQEGQPQVPPGLGGLFGSLGAGQGGDFQSQVTQMQQVRVCVCVCVCVGGGGGGGQGEDFKVFSFHLQCGLFK